MPRFLSPSQVFIASNKRVRSTSHGRYPLRLREAQFGVAESVGHQERPPFLGDTPLFTVSRLRMPERQAGNCPELRTKLLQLSKKVSPQGLADSFGCSRVGIVPFPEGTYCQSGAWYPSPSLLGFYR